MDELFGLSNSNRINTSYEILGANLLNYYHRPIKSIYHCGDIIESEEENDLNVFDAYEETECHMKDVEEIANFLNKSTQTDYRESDSQTDPWDPPFTVTKIHKEPDVLLLKDFSYGNGLPATTLEVGYIAETCKNNNLTEELNEGENEEAFQEKKKIASDQITNCWHYKIAAKAEKQLKKLESMESSLLEELNKTSEKREQILKNMWNKKKEEMNRHNLKLERKLKKEKKTIECHLHGKKTNTSLPNLPKSVIETPSNSNSDRPKSESEQCTDYLLSNYFLSNPEGLSTVKNWLEKKQSVLKNKVSLPRCHRRSHRENLAEEAYQDLLSKKRTKLPPKVYREDYEREEIVLPTAKPEDAAEYLPFEEKKIDMVTVWQQILRGLAYQKQMLKLIKKHKDGLDVSLPKEISETDSET